MCKLVRRGGVLIDFEISCPKTFFRHSKAFSTTDLHKLLAH